MRQVKLIACALGTLGAMALLLGAGGAAAQGAGGSQAKKPRPDLVMRGDAKCTRCHDDEDSPELLQIGKTRHGMNADHAYADVHELSWRERQPHQQAGGRHGAAKAGPRLQAQ